MGGFRCCAVCALNRGRGGIVETLNVSTRLDTDNLSLWALQVFDEITIDLPCRVG